MAKQSKKINPEVTDFLDELKHPLRKEIEVLRMIILDAVASLEEEIKWNGPNYSNNGEDRVTMKIQPPKKIQLIFHRGAKVKEQPKTKMMEDESGILAWKENDRAVATFETMKDIEAAKTELKVLVARWIKATL